MRFSVRQKLESPLGVRSTYRFIERSFVRFVLENYPHRRGFLITSSGASSVADRNTSNEDSAIKVEGTEPRYNPILINYAERIK